MEQLVAAAVCYMIHEPIPELGRNVQHRPENFVYIASPYVLHSSVALNIYSISVPVKEMETLTAK
jgi:hypothetical protein